MSALFKKVSVIGLGYIGLPTAAVLASRDIEVVGVEIDPKVVDIINRGEIHIVETGLGVLVKGTVQVGALKAVTKPEAAEAFMIAVPTPFKGNYEPDLSYIESACNAIAPVLKKGDLVVLESTSPVGTTEKICEWLAKARADLTFPHQSENADIFVAHCPERVLPGKVLRELIDNDRIIGGISKACTERATALYKIFVEGECIATNSRTAELSKLTENAFRDTNIAFANELSLICDHLNIDVWELIELANRHPRVNILQPGPGVGGHCIAVDPWFIVDSAPQQARLIKTAREINDGKPHYVVEAVAKAADRFKSPKIICLGLAFKPDIDDLRESPAVQIVAELADKKVGEIIAVEPHIKTLPEKLANKGIVLKHLNEAIDEADIILLLVNHKAFVNPDQRTLQEKIIIDTRGQWR